MAEQLFSSAANVAGISPSGIGEDHLPEALRAPTKPIGAGLTVVMTLANFALWLSMNPMQALLLPRQVEAIDIHSANPTPADLLRQNTDLAFVLAIGVAVSIFSNAIGGALSDRTTSRFGRRRPWILLCALLTAGTLALLAIAPSVAVLALGLALYQLFANGVLAALVAVVPDRVPERQRGIISALIGLTNPLASVLGVVLIGIVYTSYFPVESTRTLAGYATLIVVLVVVLAVFVLVLRDPPLPKGIMPPFRLGAFIRSFWVSPKAYPDFGWAWLTRFLVILGYSMAIGSFLYYFIKDGLHYSTMFPGHKPDEGVALVQIVAVAFLLISSIVGGILSDRMQRRKLFVIVSTLIISFSLVLLTFYQLYPPSLLWPMILLAGGIVGFGFGAYLGVDLALVTQVLPSAHDRGKDMGVFNIANAAPGALAPIIGAAFLNVSGNNYAVMFAAAAVMVLLGAILVQPIKSVR